MESLNLIRDTFDLIDAIENPARLTSKSVDEDKRQKVKIIIRLHIKPLLVKGNKSDISSHVIRGLLLNAFKSTRQGIFLLGQN
jgi:hypothetical protein